MADETTYENGGAESDAIIPESDFREAIAACCRDPQLNRMFRQAPAGAKLFIGLGFYSTHFGDRVVPAQYAECLAEIEPALTANDLRYLVRFERDKQTKAYLKDLLARREKEAEEAAAAVAASTERSGQAVAPQDSAPESAPAAPDDFVPVPRRRRPAFDGIQRIQSAHEPKRRQRLLKVAVLAAVVAGIGVFMYLGRGRWSGGVAVPKVSHAPVHDFAETAPTDVVEVAVADSAVTSAPPAVVAEVVKPAAVAAAEAVAVADSDEAADEEENGSSGRKGAARAAASSTDGPVRVADDSRDGGAGVRKRAVVLTDGIRIVKHADGRIEVPKRFSCAGAGIKPFWVYGASPEEDAAKERRARAEWEKLRRVAQQSAQ